MPFVDRPGCRLFYTVVDVTPPWVQDPPAIIFHHGVSATGALWSDWIPVLCDEFRLVLFDTRGFGRSTPLSGDAAWSMELLADDILAVAGAEHLERFHLVGESAGGTVALATAVSHPERLLSLTVSNAAHTGTAVRNVRGLWGERITEDGQEEWATQAWFRICPFRVTQACGKRRPVRAGLRPEGCPVREPARLPVVKPAGAEAVPGPAG